MKLPKGLFERIMGRIHNEERFLIIRRTVLFSLSAIVSFSGFVFAVKMLLTDIYQSGFLYFFSLLFSDFSVVMSYWRNFSLILLETLPTLTVILFLVLLLALLESLKLLTRNIKTMRRFAIN